MAVLLFVGFVFFVFAKGAVARSGAQSAADAAALAAAQDVRDELTDGFLDGIENGDWDDWIDGDQYGGNGYVAAEELAAENEATVTDGPAEGVLNGNTTFTVGVETTYTVGDSLIPGTEDTHARATATAVIEPRCEIEVDADPAEGVKFTCDGSGSWDIDPEDLGDVDLPKAKDLFAVHLAE